MGLTPLPNIGLTQPTPGGDEGVWDDLLNEDLALLDDHDHTSGKGLRITVAALDIDADLSFGAHAATHVATVGFDAIATPSAGARLIYWDTNDGELYVRDSNGVAVKITLGGALDVSATGGIGGDYTSIGALVSYEDANDRYLFRQQTVSTVRQWARLSSADVDLYEYKAAGDVSNIANRVRLSSPAALAASYAMTFPAALPGATSLLQVSAAGAITATNTLAANQSITLSGTGGYKRGEQITPGSFDLFSMIAASGTVAQTAGIGGVVQNAGVTAYYRLPQLSAKQRLKTLTVWAADSSGGTGFSLMTYDEGGTTMVGVTGATDIGIATGFATLTPDSPAATTAIYVLRVIAGTNDCTLKKLEILEDVP